MEWVNGAAGRVVPLKPDIFMLSFILVKNVKNKRRHSIDAPAFDGFYCLLSLFSCSAPICVIRAKFLFSLSLIPLIYAEYFFCFFLYSLALRLSA